MHQTKIMSGYVAKDRLDRRTLESAMFRLGQANESNGTGAKDVECTIAGLKRQISSAVQARFERAMDHAEYLHKKGLFTVLLAPDGNIAAVGAKELTGQTEDGRNVYYISRIVTMKGYEGRGYAQMVLGAIENEIAEQENENGHVLVVCTHAPSVEHILTNKSGYQKIDAVQYGQYLRNKFPATSLEKYQKKDQQDEWKYFEKVCDGVATDSSSPPPPA